MDTSLSLTMSVQLSDFKMHLLPAITACPELFNQYAKVRMKISAIMEMIGLDSRQFKMEV